ncbi:substrate-binding domain-containing protein [Lysobacter koreensis]|uniref:Substrate-binding domain-containing protein n=1 Tax=Lysobacter koreensis TaxID=266122 RepID=A0ABW2YI62_9GAMM
MFTIKLHAALAACLLCLCAAPSLAQDANTERLRIHGSNTMGERLVPALVKSWLQAAGYEDVSERARGASRLEIHAQRDGTPLIVEIDKRGSASGIADLIEGNTELAMMARRPNAEELDAAWQLGDLGSPDQEFVVAVDGVTAVVHASNPVRQLGIAQLRAIYAGQIRNWKQLGGPDLPIRPLLGNPRSASGEFFAEAVMAGAAYGSSAQGNVRVASGVASDPGSIGIVPLRSRVPGRARPLAISHGGLAVYPTPINILSEDYPLLRRYSLYGGQLMSALGRSFALHTVTRRAQEAVAVANHFAVMLRPAPQSPAPRASAQYTQLVAGAQRLPLSLRFNLASSQSIFDSRTAYDLDRVAAYMRLPGNRGKHAVLVAFGNREAGGALVSTLISNDRADIVAGYLQERGVRVRSAHGLGTARPLAEAAQAGARFRNERVEVWVL